MFLEFLWHVLSDSFSHSFMTIFSDRVKQACLSPQVDGVGSILQMEVMTRFQMTQVQSSLHHLMLCSLK